MELQQLTDSISIEDMDEQPIAEHLANLIMSLKAEEPGLILISTHTFIDPISQSHNMVIYFYI